MGSISEENKWREAGAKNKPHGGAIEKFAVMRRRRQVHL